MSDRKQRIRAEMEAARAFLLEAAAQIDDEKAVASTENPQWRLRDILAHLAAAEMGLVRNVDRFLAKTELPVAFDLDFWNQRQVEKRGQASISELIAELEASREAAWEKLERLSEAQLDAPGVHPAGFRTTVEGLFFSIANHELDHGNEIRHALKMPIVKHADWALALDTEERGS